MSTLMEEKMKEAITKKKVDLNSFTWKGKKVLNSKGTFDQNEKKLMSMTEYEINECYNYCNTMLFNNNPKNPGRYLLLEDINDQINRCGSELFLRLVETRNNLSRFTLLNSINEFLLNNKDAFKSVKPKIEHIFSGIPDEYLKIPLDLITDGCMDKLGIFNRKPITKTFILRQGIWLTHSESKELLENDESGKPKNRLEVVRERLNLKETDRLYLNDKGLNFTQMRAMLNLKQNKKYVDLTTVQLETLRNRVLFNLQETVKGHIVAWERRREEIELVAEFKGFNLNKQ